MKKSKFDRQDDTKTFRNLTPNQYTDDVFDLDSGGKYEGDEWEDSFSDLDKESEKKQQEAEGNRQENLRQLQEVIRQREQRKEELFDAYRKLFVMKPGRKMYTEIENLTRREITRTNTLFLDEDFLPRFKEVLMEFPDLDASAYQAMIKVGQCKGPDINRTLRENPARGRMLSARQKKLLDLFVERRNFAPQSKNRPLRIPMMLLAYCIYYIFVLLYNNPAVREESIPVPQFLFIAIVPLLHFPLERRLERKLGTSYLAHGIVGMVLSVLLMVQNGIFTACLGNTAYPGTLYAAPSAYLVVSVIAFLFGLSHYHQNREKTHTNSELGRLKRLMVRRSVYDYLIIILYIFLVAYIIFDCASGRIYEPLYTYNSDVPFMLDVFFLMFFTPYYFFGRRALGKCYRWLKKHDMLDLVDEIPIDKIPTFSNTKFGTEHSGRNDTHRIYCSKCAFYERSSGVILPFAEIADVHVSYGSGFRYCRLITKDGMKVFGLISINDRAIFDLYWKYIQPANPEAKLTGMELRP